MSDVLSLFSHDPFEMEALATDSANKAELIRDLLVRNGDQSIELSTDGHNGLYALLGEFAETFHCLAEFAAANRKAENTEVRI